MNNNVPANSPGQAIDNMTDGRDDPNRGPLDRAANAVTGSPGGLNAATSSSSNDDYVRTQGGGVVSAVFDSDDEARAAVAELRSSGIDDASLSLITQKRGTTTTSNADGDVVDEEHTSLLRGILGGGALGAGLGVAALAIPGVGPLVAAGAIAASAIPGAMAIGAAAGAAVGTLNESLKAHGVSDDDVAYYGDHMPKGGVLVTVRTQGSETPHRRRRRFFTPTAATTPVAHGNKHAMWGGGKLDRLASPIWSGRRTAASKTLRDTPAVAGTRRPT